MAKKKTRVLLPGGIQGLVHDLQNGGTRNAPRPLDDDENAAQNADGGGKAQTADSQLDSTDGGVSGANAATQATDGTQTTVSQQDRVGEGGSMQPSATPAENGVQTHNPAPAPVQPGHTEGGMASEPPAGPYRDRPETTYDPVGRSGGAGRRTGGAAANRPIGAAAVTERAYSPGRPAKQDTMKEYHIVKDDSRDSWDLFLDMAKQYKDGGGKLATIYIDGTLKNVLDRMKYVGPEKLPTSAMLSSIVARFIYDHEDEIRRALFSGDLI